MEHQSHQPAVVLSSNGHAKKIHQAAEIPKYFLTKSESVVISPSGENPTPKGFYDLSNLDQTFSYPIEILFKYENENRADNIDVSDVLKKSLSKVLEVFYPLGGGMDVSWDGRVLVDCGRGYGGVPFVEAYCDEDMVEAFGNITKVDDKLAELMYSDEKPYGTILDVSPLTVQVTKFKCGGIILGVGFNHVLMDGRAFADFMLYWAEVANGLAISTHPHLDRSIFSASNPPKIQRSHPEYSKSKSPLIPIYMLGPKTGNKTILNKSFTFSPTDVAQLRKLAVQEDIHNMIPTKFELISAVIWISWAKAMQVKPQNTTQILTAVDGRPKYQTPIPKRYFGNGIVWSCARSKMSDLTSKPFSYAVRVVHEAIREVTEEYVQSTIDYHEVMRKPLEQDNTLWITKWSKLPFYDVEFSWGRPSQVAPASLVNNLAVSLSEGKDNENLVVSISLPAEAMEVFQESVESEWK